MDISKNAIAQAEIQYGANYYHPLPVVIERGEGIYLWDTEGKRYIDMMSAYSAVSHGHCHPRLVAEVQQQAARLGIISRAFYSDKLGPFLAKLAQVTGFPKAIPMNTGAEAVESAIKAARKWAYEVKGVADNQAEIIACNGNFHGRTITIVGLSSEPGYQAGFGPFPAGLKRVPYNDAKALADAITPNTAAFLVEPIQGENGIVIPTDGYLAECAKICKANNVLLICDEIQTGLGRTGKLFAYQHDNIQPDGIILGKALGGGMLPVSAFVATNEILDLFKPGDHGSTFGGYPIAAAVGLTALEVLEQENLVNRSQQLGEKFLTLLTQKNYPFVRDIRGRGLFIGVEVDPEMTLARPIVEKLLAYGLLSKETHETVIRLAPPLIITEDQLEAAFAIIDTVFSNLSSG